MIPLTRYLEQSNSGTKQKGGCQELGLGLVGEVRSWYFMRIFRFAGWKGSGDLLYNHMHVVDNTELHIWEAEFDGVFFPIKKYIPYFNINIIYIM